VRPSTVSSSYDKIRLTGGASTPERVADGVRRWPPAHGATDVRESARTREDIAFGPPVELR
jgi:hypothetical protein